MSEEIVHVDDEAVKFGLRTFALSLRQEKDLGGAGGLMKQIGASMLLSVRRTFREQGSPAGSWAPLAASTIRGNPKKYGAGHKTLIGTGMLLNSIGYKQTGPGQVVISTNLKYAAVHQFGSRDRGAMGEGPRTKAQDEATVNVKEHTYLGRLQTMGKKRVTAVDSLGRVSKRSRIIVGPRNRRQVHVGGHTRHQNIPARPYLVFRPEDPQRIQGLVTAFVGRARTASGLGGA